MDDHIRALEMSFSWEGQLSNDDLYKIWKETIHKIQVLINNGQGSRLQWDNYRKGKMGEAKNRGNSLLASGKNEAAVLWFGLAVLLDDSSQPFPQYEGGSFISNQTSQQFSLSQGNAPFSSGQASPPFSTNQPTQGLPSKQGSFPPAFTQFPNNPGNSSFLPNQGNLQYSSGQSIAQGQTSQSNPKFNQSLPNTQFPHHTYSSPQSSSQPHYNQNLASPQQTSQPQQRTFPPTNYSSPNQFGTSPTFPNQSFGQGFGPSPQQTDYSAPLPQGWEIRREQDGTPYFYNTFTMDRTSEDPRVRPSSSSSQSGNRNILGFGSPSTPSLSHSTTPFKTRNVTVFWDFENCAVPTSTSASAVVSAIRNFALSKGGELKHILAIGNLNLLPDVLRKPLQNSGVSLHDVPSSHKANQSDFALLTELFKFVLDNPPPHEVVLITGDSDFSAIVHTLRNRTYDVILIHGQSTSREMVHSSSQSFLWPNFLLNGGQNLVNSTELQYFSPEPGNKATQTTSKGPPPSSQKKKRKYDSLESNKSVRQEKLEKRLQLKKERKEKLIALKKSQAKKLKNQKSIYNPLVREIENTLRSRGLPLDGKVSVETDLTKLDKKKSQYGFNSLREYMEAAAMNGFVRIENQGGDMLVSLSSSFRDPISFDLSENKKERKLKKLKKEKREKKEKKEKKEKREKREKKLKNDSKEKEHLIIDLSDLKSDSDEDDDSAKEEDQQREKKDEKEDGQENNEAKEETNEFKEEMDDSSSEEDIETNKGDTLDDMDETIKESVEEAEEAQMIDNESEIKRNLSMEEKTVDSDDDIVTNIVTNNVVEEKTEQTLNISNVAQESCLPEPANTVNE